MVDIKHILCPTDFSPAAEKAIAYAQDLARVFGAKLLLLHVVPPSDYPMRNFGAITGFPNLREEIKKHAAEELAAIGKKVKGVTAETELREGQPHEEILAAAAQHGIKLIVMSTHGHTGIKHALLGSTAERVVRLSECPVLTVRVH